MKILNHTDYNRLERTKFIGFDKFPENLIVTHFFDKRFGSDWKEKDKFFQEFEESLRKSEEV